MGSQGSYQAGAEMTADTATAPTFTEVELKEFDRLTWATGHPHQLTRIAARFDLQAFVNRHGNDKCNAMFEALKKKDRRA